MILRMSKKERPYILRQERAGYYAEEIKKATEALTELKDEKEIKEKKDLISALTKLDAKQKKYLENYEPTIFDIINASKERLAKKEMRQSASLGKLTEDATELTAGMTGITKVMAIEAFKEGFVRMRNYYDMATPKDNRKPLILEKNKIDDVIDMLSLPEIQEVANEIMGGISEEEDANLD